jgi:hypothetical protein
VTGTGLAVVAEDSFTLDDFLQVSELSFELFQSPRGSVNVTWTEAVSVLVHIPVGAGGLLQWSVLVPAFESEIAHLLLLFVAVYVSIIQVLAQPVNQKTVVFLPRYRVYVFGLTKVKDTPVAQVPGSTS